MLGVLLSWLIQLLLVHKVFFFGTRFLFSQPFLAPAPSVCEAARQGKVQVPITGWFVAAWSLAPHTVPLLTARTNNYQSGLSHKSLPSVQGALSAEQKDLEGLRGYSFKTPSWMEERMLSAASDCTRELCSLLKCLAPLLLPAAVPALGSVAYIWGQGNRFSHSACYWYVLLCLYMFYRVGLAVLSPG